MPLVNWATCAPVYIWCIYCVCMVYHIYGVYIYGAYHQVKEDRKTHRDILHAQVLRAVTLLAEFIQIILKTLGAHKIQM